MPITNYDYSIAGDFPDGMVNTAKLDAEIRSSAITIALNRIDTSGDNLSIWFNDTLPTGDKTILDGDTSNPAGGLIAAHDNSPSNPPSVLATLGEAGVMEDPDVVSNRRNGYVGSSSTNTTTVRATSYTPQGTDAQRSVSSTSANDTAAGTGARTVRITYYNAACQGPFTTDVTLNGTTAVNTAATDIALIEKIEVLTVGSGGGNAGTIRVWTATGGGGSVWGSIAAEDNQTYWAHHYVPVGKTCFITELDASGKPTSGIVTLNVLDPTDTEKAQRNLDISYSYGDGASPNMTKRFAVPLTVSGPAIIFVNSKLDTGLLTSTTHAAIGFFERKT